MEEDSIILEVSPDKLEFSSSGSTGYSTVHVTSNTNWRYSYDDKYDEWMSVLTSSSLSGNGSLSVYVWENKSLSQRIATINVRGGGKERTVLVSQEGVPIFLSTYSLDFLSSGGQKSFSIESNTNWTVSHNETNWLTISTTTGSNNGTITVTATANPSLQSRTAIITVSGGGIKRTMNVTQSGVFSSRVSFWVSKDFLCGWITVTLESNGTATINGISTSGTPDCGAAYNGNFYSVLPGTYSYTASCSGGRKWSGNVTVVKDGSTCILVKLE